MDIQRFINDLTRERDLIDSALNVLEREAERRGRLTKRRGRPRGSKNRPKNASPEESLTLT